jgi:gamma-glutamyl-gamma-aminobutyrate hydrolase PuuD
VINTYLGGTLHQHLPDEVGHSDHAPGPGQYGSHPVRVDPASRLAAVLGRTALDGEPSAHHQAIDRLGKGLTAVAWAPDGIIEAVDIDAPGCPFALAVQWHPEAGTDLSLFRALVAAARPVASVTS